MKKTILPIAVLLLCSVITYAQGNHEMSREVSTPGSSNTSNPNAAKIKFVQEIHDFGTVIEGPQVTYDFKFKNEGKEPLILSNVRASCGCTVPTWPKEPILPGKESVISATYNTQGRPGNFTKTITVESNASEGNKVVTIKGDVIKPEDDKSIPLARPSMLKTNN